MIIAEFNHIYQSINKKTPNILIQSSSGYDARFRDLDVQNKKEIKNSYQSTFLNNSTSFHANQHYIGDFTWNSPNINTIAIYNGISSKNGHSGLTSQGATYCAGVIEENGFFFHSGHFKPKAKQVLRFMTNFIQASLEEFEINPIEAFENKKALLTELCENFPITVYFDNSNKNYHQTTFLELYQHIYKKRLPFTQEYIGQIRQSHFQESQLESSQPTEAEEPECLLYEQSNKGSANKTNDLMFEFND